MSRHFVTSGLLARYCIGSSSETLVHSARCQLLIQGLYVRAANLSTLSHPLLWHCTSYQLFSPKHCFPVVSRVSSSCFCQPVPSLRTSERQKNTYYGFAKRKPEPLSRLGKIYLTFLSVGIASFIVTPLYVPVLIF